MTVKELRNLLVNLPDDMIVVAAGHDHSFHQVRGSVVNAVEENHQTYSEWYHGQPGHPIKVFCMGD